MKAATAGVTLLADFFSEKETTELPLAASASFRSAVPLLGSGPPLPTSLWLEASPGVLLGLRVSSEAARGVPASPSSAPVLTMTDRSCNDRQA